MSLAQLTKHMSVLSTVAQQEMLQQLPPRMQALCTMVFEASREVCETVVQWLIVCAQAKALHSTPLQQIESKLHDYTANYSRSCSGSAMVSS